ncbi:MULTISPECIES: hypothetical protein [unclassified Microcoleus]|uniref:hypothetical protein n=1 Tax=unclassified Microcoleus TaxID=2642155 RepID=UPI002FD5B1B6
MGAWGTGILQNDTTADIWVEFKELYNKGLSLKEIRLKLEKEYKPQSDTEYYGEIWTGIAYGQWMCGDVEDYTFKKLNDATKLKWLTLWADDKKLLEKRINAISNFKQKIQTPRPNPLKRKKIVERPIIYKRGDVIALKIDDYNSLTGIVVETNEHPNYLENTIILTDLVFTDTPTENQILSSNVLYLDIGGEYRYHRGFFRALFTTKNMARKAKQTTKIGELQIKDCLSVGNGLKIGDWNKIGALYFEQIEFLKTNKSDKPFNVSLKDLINPNQKLQDKLIDWDKKLFQEKLESRRQNAT